MQKNYYEILQVDKSASPEIIEKVYKLLVKEYHPDLQSGELKTKYEEKLKLINEAYDVLSDPVKRSEYDKIISTNSISEEQFNALYNDNQLLKTQLYQMQSILQQININNASFNPYNSNANFVNNYHANKSINNNITNENNYYDYNSNQEQDESFQEEPSGFSSYIRDLKNSFLSGLLQLFKKIIAIFITILFLLLILRIFL